MVRWRRPDAETSGDDDLSAERAVWLRAPREAPLEPFGGERGNDVREVATGDPRVEPAPRSSVGDYPPRYPVDPPVDLDRGPTRGPAYPSDGYGSIADDTDPPDSGADLDRPPRRRKLVPLLVITAVLAVLGAVASGLVDGPDDGPDTVATPGPSVAVPAWTAQVSFEPLDPTASATPSVPPSATVTATAAPVAATTRPAGAAAPSPTPVTTTKAAITFAATSGPGCANTVTTRNWYTNSQDGTWWTGTGGAAECGGAALAMPSSGSATTDTDDYVVWWFETGPVVAGSCAVDVYIPNTTRAGGKPAQYKILGGRVSSTVIASFTIDQTANRGRWVRARTLSITGGAISIHLANRGNAGVFLGAAQVRVACTA